MPEAATPSPTPVKMAPPTSPRWPAGTCGSTASAASTIIVPPAIPAAKRQVKNQANGSGKAQAKNEAVASSIIARKTAAAAAARLNLPAISAPTR